MTTIRYRKHCISQPLIDVEFWESVKCDDAEVDLTILGLQSYTRENPFKSTTGGTDFYCHSVSAQP